MADGTNPGLLHCPSMGEGKNSGCRGDDEKGVERAIKQCKGVGGKGDIVLYHRAVTCEW